MSAPPLDAALLALQGEAATINALCMALSVRVIAGKSGIKTRAGEAAQEAAARVWIEMHDRIAATPARTIAGLQFKARFSPTPWLDPVMMRAIVEDLLAL